MSLDDFADFVASSKQHFEEGLIRAGFVERDEGWVGGISHPNGITEVVLTLLPRFPFTSPKVMPLKDDGVSWSWHRERDGALCLVADDDHQDLWWTEASAFLAHVTAWFECSDAGWSGDRPDLDLDRYFEPANDDRLFLYGDLDEQRGTLVRFVRAANNTMRLSGKGTRPAKPARKHSSDLFGYIADLGDLDRPPRKWEDLAARIDPHINLEKRIRQRSISLLVLLYNRGGHEGTVLLEVWPTTTGTIAVRRLRGGADTTAARASRSGPRATELTDRRVAVIGVGALGSFIADLLIRAGVGHLTLVDDDTVMPGNVVRHLVGFEAVGLPKAIAVRNNLVRSRLAEPSRVIAQTEAVTTSDAAVRLVQNHDLVVNATAEFPVTALLRKVAESLAKTFLSVTLQNDGDTYRIDVLPPLLGAASLPNSASVPQRPIAPYFEAGCGSPISPTAPYAVAEAAAATVRHAIGLLLNDPVHPSGEVRHLVPDPATS